MNRPPIYKTYAGLTAQALINRAEIITTGSNDHPIRVEDLELNLTEDNYLIVSSYGTGLALLDLTNEQVDAMQALYAKTEEMYAADLLRTTHND